jgi:hypothetical protein
MTVHKSEIDAQGYNKLTNIKPFEDFLQSAT